MELSPGANIEIVALPVPSHGMKELTTDDPNACGVHKEAVVRSETAAVEVQRLYRGYRARRSIADAATMAQKFGWWDVVDGAMLDYNSTQFYAYSAPQNATQRWLRLTKKAAKVGKGLSKNEKARKLALQHWLEAIDPRHRYGHNLHFYFEEWENCQTQEPFFYWLDVGEGKDVDLKQKSKRSKLQKELIRYLSPKERKWYEVLIEDGKLKERMTGVPVDTPKGDKWIFVMSTTGKLYVGKKEKGKLQHSSFLAGGATTAAGRLRVNNGTIELMEAHSGHYHPTEENFQELISILNGRGADLTMAEIRFCSDDMLSSNSTKSIESHDAVEKTIQESDAYEDGRTEMSNNGEDSVLQLASLALEDDIASSISKVALMEDTLSPAGQDNGDVELEGHEIVRINGRFNDIDSRENLEWMKLEVTKPGEISKPTHDEMPGAGDVKASIQDAIRTRSKRSLTTSPSNHKLFAPAMQAFHKLEGRPGIGLPDLHDAKPENTLELTPKTKLLLLRKLSMHRPLVTPS